MIDMKKQIWRTGAFCLAGVVALSVTGATVYAKTSEKKETEIKTQIQDAVEDIWKSEDTSAASVDETVYVILNADGTQKKIYVSDWLKNQGEKDSYTQSTPDKEAPVSLKVSYTLDGTAVSPEDIVGKSGHVVIRYDYTNELYETRDIAGTEEKIYVPFAVMTGMIVDNDHFSNIQVSSGKVINDGSHSVVTGIVFPGLGSNLDMEDDLDDYLEIEADVDDFTMNETYCIATNSVFSRLDLSNIDDLDDLKDAMNGLDDATMQLMDGSAELYDGVSELYDKSGDLTDGVDKLADGAGDLKDGADKIASGSVDLRKGIYSLQDGAKSLQGGSKTLLAGTQSLQSGTKELKSGLGQLTAQNDALTGGAGQIFDVILGTANTSLSELIGQGLMSSLTKENYATELTKASQTLAYLSGNETAARALVLAQAGLSEDAYQAMKAAIAAAGAGSGSAGSGSGSGSVSGGDADTSVSGGDAGAQTSTQAATRPDYVAIVNSIDQNTAALMTKFAQAKPQVDSLKTSLDSVNTFYQGLLAYTAGVASANAGAEKLTAGADQLVSGAGQLSDGTGSLVSGTDQLLSGANVLVNGTNDLAEGAGTLKDGVNTLSDGSDKLIDGIRQLRDGAKELKDGIVTFNDEGISKLTELDTDELQEVIDRMKATASVSENYDSFTGSNDGMSGSVKFIYKINAVK